VLDRLNIEVMRANRVAPGRGLAAPRFRWVSYGDPLMLPLDASELARMVLCENAVRLYGLSR
jgi:hypothetical protein